MLQGKRRYIPAFAVLGCSAIAMAAQPTTEELQAQISALTQKVQALEAKQVSAADVDATVQRVLEDSERRSQLLAAEGFTSGYTNGRFVIQSADGNFLISPALMFQGRYVGNYREDATATGIAGKASHDSSYDDGFEIRRMKFGFGGNAVSKDLTYKFQWASERGTSTTTRNLVNARGEQEFDNTGSPVSVTDQTTTGGTPLLEDAWVRFRFADNFAVYGGQFETPIGHEALVSSSRQLAVEESLADFLMITTPTDYTQGVGLAYETQPFRAQGVFHDGGNTERNTKFYDNTAEWGVAARAEWMAMGNNWKEYDDFTALGNKSDLLVLGAGADLTEFPDKDVVYHAADVQWEPSGVPGLSAFAGYVAQWINPRTDAEQAYNYGIVGQVGYLVTPKFEVFGRYDITYLDQVQFATDVRDHVQEVTAGINYYINGHAAKFTADMVWLPDGLDSNLTGFNSADGLGLLPTSGSSNEVVARVQFQLLL